jgi:hypothetical protein
MDEIVESAVLMLFRKVLKEEEASQDWRSGTICYLPRMVLANIGTMNTV